MHSLEIHSASSSNLFVGSTVQKKVRFRFFDILKIKDIKDSYKANARLSVFLCKKAKLLH